MEKRQNKLWLSGLPEVSQEALEEEYAGTLDLPSHSIIEVSNQPPQSAEPIGGMKAEFEHDWNELKGMLMLTAVKQLKVEAVKHIQTYDDVNRHDAEATVIDVEEVQPTPLPQFEITSNLDSALAMEGEVIGSPQLTSGMRDGFDAEEYEGAVRLIVKFDKCVKEFMSFVQELNKNPRLRLLGLVGRKYGAEISLTVREASALETLLPEFDGVCVSSEPISRRDSADDKLICVRISSATNA